MPRMSNDFYKQIANWYDLEFASFDDDHELYLGYASLVGSPILELGCGTGRLIAALAEAGFNVTGVDSSPDMIAGAASRLETQGVQAGLRQADMRDLQDFPERSFKLIFSAINSFLHMMSREDQCAALSSARRLLHPDGLLVLDIFHPTPATLQAMDDRLTFDTNWILPDGEQLQRLTQRRLSTAHQIVETTHHYDRVDQDGLVRRSVASYTMRYIHRYEMEGLLVQNGFDIEGVYGSYALDPLTDNSDIMVFVAHRRD